MPCPSVSLGYAMPSRWAALRATVHAVEAVSAAPQLFISTPLEPKEQRDQETLAAEPVPHTAQLPRPSLSLRRGQAREEKQETPEPQLICTPRTRSPLADGEVKSDASKIVKAEGVSTRSSLSFRPSTTKPDLRRAGSHSSQGSPLPSDGHLNLKIGDVTAPTSKPSNRRPKLKRNTTFTTSTKKEAESEMRPARKLFRNASADFDSKTVTTLEKEKRLEHAVTDPSDPMSGESSPWSRPMTSFTSDSPRGRQEEIAPEAPSEQPSRTTSAVVNLHELDELGDLPPAEMPLPTEDDVHDQHPTERRGRSSYDHHDSLKSSEGSLQRVPSSSSRSQSSEPSEHDNLSKDPGIQRQAISHKKPQTSKSRRRNRSKGRDPSQEKKESKQSADGKTAKRKNSRGLRGSQSDLSEEEGKQPSSKKNLDKEARKRKTSRARSVSRASSGASGGSRRSLDFKRSPRSSRSPKPSSKEALVQQRQSLRARFASEVPEGEVPGRKSGKVAFLRKAWSQARCALLGLQEPQVQDDNDPRAKGLRGWDAARALCVGTGRALKDIKNVVSLVKKAADEAYHRHRVQKAIVEEIETTLRGSMANVSDEMDETIGDVLADLTRLKWLDMTEIGALVCEAILNFDEDENETITSPASLRDQLLQHCQSLPNREEVLGMDDRQIEVLLDHIMHRTESLRDQLRTSVRFSMPDEDAHQHQHHCSKLRQMDSSRLTGMDTVEVAEEERESVESILSRMGSRVETEPKALLDPVQEAALPQESTPRCAPPPRRQLRPGTQSPRPRTADKSRESNEADDLPLLVSSSSTLPREPRKMPRPTRKQLEMAGFSHAAGLLEVSKRSVLYAAMTTFPYMQTFPVVMASKVPNPEMREVSSTGAVLPILVTPRPLSPSSRRHAGASSP